MEATVQAWPDWIFNVYTLIAWIIAVVLGVIMGIKERIVIFRDYNDLGLVFLIGLVPIVLMYLFALTSEASKNVAFMFTAIAELIVFLWLVIRTFKDNSNPAYGILALVTKISLSVLFIINLLDFVTPAGKTSSKRASSRRKGFAFLLFLTPIVFTLVRNKTGIFNPERTLARRGIGV
jgi:hypothetical protein